jgi:hypothetical protein
MENELKLAHHGKVFMTTTLYLSYIKTLIKVNVLLNKYYRSDKGVYVEEILNIFKMINNNVDIYKDLNLILNYIEPEYKEYIKTLLTPEGKP